MKKTFIASLFLFILLGCNTAPVKLIEFQDQPLKYLYNQSISMQEVQLDIRMAAGKAGWNAIADEIPGLITASRSDGKISATVEIIFDLNKYSIYYKSSSRLDYKNGCASKDDNGTTKLEKECVNPTYNEWVKELNDAISLKLQY